MDFKVEKVNGGGVHDRFVVWVQFDGEDVRAAAEFAKAKMPHVNIHSPGGVARTAEEKQRRLVAGKLADHAVRDWLRHYAEGKGLNHVVEEYDAVRKDGFEHPDAWDLRMTAPDETAKTLEVRSSFVHLIDTPSSLIWNEGQSLLGWYTTGAKAFEPHRDLYWQVAFFMRPADVSPQQARKGISVFNGMPGEEGISAVIMGGATRELLEAIGEEALKIAEGAKYMVIRPMARAFCAGAMTRLTFGLEPMPS